MKKIICAILSVLMLVFAITKRKTSRVEGGICLLLYAAYMAYIIMRTFHIWIF